MRRLSEESTADPGIFPSLTENLYSELESMIRMQDDSGSPVGERLNDRARRTLKNMPTEAELEKRLMAGETDSLAVVFEFYRNRLRTAVNLRIDKRVCGRLDPSDVIQEAFLTAARELPGYIADPKATIFVWLHGLTTRRLSDLHRDHLATGMRAVNREAASLQGAGGFPDSGLVLSELVADSLPSPSSVVLREERKQQVLDGLAELDETDREVLILRHFESLSNDETAMILALSRTAASNRYIRSLQRLEVVLSKIMERT